MKKNLILVPAGILILLTLIYCGMKFFPSNSNLAEANLEKPTSQNDNTKGFTPKQIIFIRHGEKTNADGSIQKVDLSVNGVKRANELPDFFINHLPDPINKPEVIIATKQEDKKHSNRPFETIEPLSKALKLPIIANYKQSEVEQAVEDINKYGTDKTVLVCWEHKYLVKIAQLLGAPVNNWSDNPQAAKDDDKNYDAIWVITKLDDTRAELAVYKEFAVSDDGEISYDQVSNKPIYRQEFQYK